MLDVRSVFANAVESMDVNVTVDLSDLEFSKNHPFKTPVSVVGKITHSKGSVVLNAVAQYDYSAPCDRCATDVVKGCKTTINHILVSELSNEDTEDYVLIEDMILDIDDLVRTDLILAMPSKFLCKEDCKGLCTKCGKDLNEGKCRCDEVEVDPRLAALKQFLN